MSALQTEVVPLAPRYIIDRAPEKKYLYKTGSINDIVLLCGNSNVKLAKDIAQCLKLPLNEQNIPSQFANTEIRSKILDDLRGQNVYIIQSGCRNIKKNLSVNDIIFELLVLVDSCRRSMAASVNIIMPYYPYSRSDKKDEPRAPISAKLLANLLESTKIDRLVSIDLHAAQIQGFLDTPFDNLYSAILVIDKLDNTIFKNLTLEERQNKFIVVSPDAGAAKRTLALAKRMKLNTIIMHKQRDYSKPNYVEKTIIIHDISNKVHGKKAIICDDIADTCGTLVSAINELVKFGFEDIICVITHGIFSNNAIEKINNCKYISRFIVSDSIPQVENCKKCPKLEVFSISNLMANIIERIQFGGPISDLFVY